MTRFAFLSVSVLALALSACAGAEADPKTSASPATSTPPTSAVAACEQFLTHAKTCTADYIPALVDLRVELDQPAGIAAAAQTDGRDSLIARANEEWATDSQPAAIHAACEHSLQSMPAEQLETMAAEGARCDAMTDCAEFSTCAMGLQRQRMQ